MATVNGTAGKDFIHRAGDGLVAPNGYVDLVGATSGADVINGFGGNDILNGNNGNDILDGGIGADIMRGGKANDTYVVDNVGDVVDESVPGADGIDTILSSVSINLTQTTLYRGAIENVTLTGALAINATGNDLANLLIGNSAANIVDGGNGADTMRGLGGNDTYGVNSLGDLVDESAAGSDGIDTVRSTISFSLVPNAQLLGDVENLTLLGTAAIDATGNRLDNRLTGNSAANVLDGRNGADVMIGFGGDDTYMVSNPNDVVDEAQGGSSGIDTVRSAITYSLAQSTVLFGDVENLTLTGGSNLNGTGNGLANRLTGNTGINVLTGGGGSDVYVVQNTGDQVVEGANGGTDLVESSASFTLGANVENLTLTGTAAINGTGNGLANRLIGNEGVNILNGGDGDDVYVVQTAGDQVVEERDVGIDRVESSVAFTLGDNLENLTLTGGAKINGNGNGLDNRLIGNSAANRLNGFEGADRMAGVGGGDTYVVDNVGDVVNEGAAGSDGIDLVESSISFSLANTAAVLGAVENLSLTGSAGINATGNGLVNRLIGNSGANILDGGAGADVMRGMAASDVYVVDNAGDIVDESVAGSSGIDTVEASISYSLAPGGTVLGSVENLTLTGSAAINGTGNGLANRLTGNAGTNILTGGGGDDVYVVQNTTDQVVEEDGGGVDTVESTSLSYGLGDWVENLTLIGSADLSGTGNDRDNHLRGNSGVNLLDGGGGADLMQGFGGNDGYVVDNMADVVDESVAGSSGNDVVYAWFTYSLEQSATVQGDIENLVLTGSANLNGTGNALENRLEGNAGVNILTGLAGDDTYVIQNIEDQVIEAANGGRDTVEAWINFTLGANVENLVLAGTANLSGTGNDGANRITGNGNDNILNGGAGKDTMFGLGGNDTYIVDNEGDFVIDVGGGIDLVESSVNYTLSTSVENLTLTGTANLRGVGNGMANTMIGNSGANRLNGNAGPDRMVGLGGNDIYFVDNLRDVVDEGVPGSSGNDEVRSSISIDIGNSTYFKGSIEKVTLLDEVAAYSVTGNNDVNHLIGNKFDNILNGGGGADYMQGGAGHDIYYFDDIGDVADETPLSAGGTLGSDGFDLIYTPFSIVLDKYIEHATLTGSNDVNATGTSEDNRLRGNDGANVLDGLRGSDKLFGGGGADSFFFGTGGVHGASIIEDFSGSIGGDGDVILLKKEIFDFPTELEFLGSGDFTPGTDTLQIRFDDVSETLQVARSGDPFQMFDMRLPGLTSAMFTANDFFLV